MNVLRARLPQPFDGFVVYFVIPLNPHRGLALKNQSEARAQGIDGADANLLLRVSQSRPDFVKEFSNIYVEQCGRIFGQFFEDENRCKATILLTLTCEAFKRALDFKVDGVGNDGTALCSKVAECTRSHDHGLQKRMRK